MQLIRNRRTGTSKRLWNPTIKGGSHISPRRPESQTDVLPLPSGAIKIVIFGFKFEKCVQFVLARSLMAQVFECELLVVVAWTTGQDLIAIVAEWCSTSLLRFDQEKTFVLVIPWPQCVISFEFPLLVLRRSWTRSCFRLCLSRWSLVSQTPVLKECIRMVKQTVTYVKKKNNISLV